MVPTGPWINLHSTPWYVFCLKCQSESSYLCSKNQVITRHRFCWYIDFGLSHQKHEKQKFVILTFLILFLPVVPLFLETLCGEVVYMPICMYVWRSGLGTWTYSPIDCHQSICLSASLPVHPSICSSIHPSVCPSVCLSVHLFVYFQTTSLHQVTVLLLDQTGCPGRYWDSFDPFL